MADKIERMSERLAALLRDLASNPDYASGRRRYPRTVTADDAADIAEAFHEQVDKGVEMRGEVAKRQLQVIACSRGCHACCNEPIMVTLPEAMAVARWLDRPENAAARAGFMARYETWRAQALDNAHGLAEASARGDAAEAIRLHRAARSLCPLNQGGDCSVYPVRPLLCRSAHALETSERCGRMDKGEVQALDYTPLEQFIAKAKEALWAAHHALPNTPRRLFFPLPEAVYAVLTGTR